MNDDQHRVLEILRVAATRGTLKGFSENYLIRTYGVLPLESTQILEQLIKENVLTRVHDLHCGNCLRRLETATAAYTDIDSMEITCMYCGETSEENGEFYATPHYNFTPNN